MPRRRILISLADKALEEEFRRMRLANRHALLEADRYPLVATKKTCRWGLANYGSGDARL